MTRQQVIVTLAFILSLACAFLLVATSFAVFQGNHDVAKYIPIQLIMLIVNYSLWNRYSS